MTDRLQRSLTTLSAAERTITTGGIDTRAKLIVTLVFLIALLSTKLTAIAEIMLFALYPILGARAVGASFGQIFRRSLIAMPFVVMVGIFNPIFDREPMLTFGGIVISRGWLTLFSIILRGVIAVQAVLLLLSSGFVEVCRSMGRLGVPPLLTSGMIMIHRYIFIVAADGQALLRGVEARRASRKALPLKLWAVVVGQLLIRSVERAERIGAAMLARGFDGRFRAMHSAGWTLRDTLYTVALSSLFIFMRIVRPSALFDLL